MAPAHAHRRRPVRQLGGLRARARPSTRPAIPTAAGASDGSTSPPCARSDCSRDLRGAHGITFDEYAASLFLFGSFSILQIDSGTPDVISSQRNILGLRFDQGTVDGRGHLFAADNGGKLVFIDYSATRKVGDRPNRVETRFLDPGLDDLAPLTGPGARPAAKGKSRTPLFLLVGVALVVVLVTVVVVRRRRAVAAERRGPR